jgi:hypothetical protein
LYSIDGADLVGIMVEKKRKKKMNIENVKPVYRETAHGTIAIFLYPEFHRVYLVKGEKNTFLFQRKNK